MYRHENTEIIFQRRNILADIKEVIETSLLL